jgi:hypothetical protein
LTYETNKSKKLKLHYKYCIKREKNIKKGRTLKVGLVVDSRKRVETVKEN